MSVFPLLITIVPDTKSNAISVLSKKKKKKSPIRKKQPSLLVRMKRTESRTHKLAHLISS